jgi:tRNA pseudouridine55 synthase
VNGVLLLDKPAGPTSHDVVRWVRNHWGVAKVGHAGTLDPFATGLLVLLIGEATKISDYLLNQDKVYDATIKWGEATDTQDLTGQVNETTAAPLPSNDELRAALARFTGTFPQMPPMYSAKKLAGRPLYRLARQGIDVSRDAKRVTVFALSLLDRDEAARTFTLQVHCSKGTYVRSLADALARALGGLGHLAALRRLKSGNFDLDRALPWDRLQDLPPAEAAASLLPMETALAALPLVVVTPRAQEDLRHGISPARDGVARATPYGRGETLRLADEGGKLLALARALDDARRLDEPARSGSPFELLRVFSAGG